MTPSPQPVADLDDFMRMVDVAFKALPEKFRALIHNVHIRVLRDVSASDRSELQLAPDETLLGLYTGIPLSEREFDSTDNTRLPDTVTLYMDPLITEANGDPSVLQRVITDTLWHELGHYFGMDEDQVQTKEREQTRSIDRE
jgi:predicted Zn-dependent protease with MMP-like domain